MTHNEQQTRLRAAEQQMRSQATDDGHPHSPAADEQEVRLRTTKARQGEASGRIRKVLLISVTAAFLAMLLAWWYFFGGLV
jgi:hypothetical protein